MTRNIPGVVDGAALAALLGDEPARAADNAPQTRPEFRCAAVEMLGRGMRLDDVAAALRISRQGVLDLLGEQRDIDRDRREQPTQQLMEFLERGRAIHRAPRR